MHGTPITTAEMSGNKAYCLLSLSTLNSKRKNLLKIILKVNITTCTRTMRTGKRNGCRQPDDPRANHKTERDYISKNQLS